MLIVSTRKSLRRRLAALFLTLAAVATILVPATAFADDPPAGIALGTDALEAGCNTGDAQMVYFGVGTGNGEEYPSMQWTDPYSWYVIGYDGSGAASASGVVTLFATDNFGSTKFNADSSTSDADKYAGSLLQARVALIAGDFSSLESGAISTRTLETGEFKTYASSKPADYHEPFCDGIAGEAVDNAVLWPLSTQEAWDVEEDMTKNTGDTWTYEGTIRSAGRMPTELGDSNACNWWLRSPGQSKSHAATTTGHGDVLAGGGIVDNVRGIRPAFHLDMDAVLFVSAAEGGKPDGTGSLSEVGTNDTGKWKLTLLDSSRSFAVSEASIEGEVGDSLDLTYTGATVGENEYISAILIDGDGNIIRYGKLGQAKSSSGTVAVPIPSDLAAGTYTLKVFEEQRNGDCRTDYASALSDVELKAEDATVKYTITFVNDDGTELQSGKVTEGEKPKYEGTEPTKPATAQYSYQFKGWSPAIAPATADVTYTATYTKSVNEYTVTFVDEDGTTVLQSGKVAYGKTPKYEGAKPTKPATSEHSYKFDGWSPEIATVTGDATYTATYTEGPLTSTLTFDLAGGKLDGKTGTFTIVANMGETIKLPKAPTRKGYTFKCWKGSEYAAGADFEVEGDHTFTASWTKKSTSNPSNTHPKKGLPATGDDRGTAQAALACATIGSLFLLTACLLKRKAYRGLH